jgi:phosphate/phosphite/phosphonate ABC transporter binding protein
MANYDDERPGIEATDVLPPTRLIGGKYRLGRLLGEGGMGAVYEAEHTGLGTIVAVKLLNESFVTDQNALSRFRREARAAAAIRHENVVSVFDTGTDDEGIPFIVMELLEGESLSALLRREHVLPPAIAATITLHILAALAAAHEKTIIHRDLKPGNVLLAGREDGSHVVKVLDFGISKYYSDPALPDVTATGAVIGTPRFMAPEQARGERDIDTRVDLYATGVLLYRMVTGKLPFSGSTQREIIDNILAGNPPPPRTVRASVPEDLERVLLKSLAVNRDDRYQTAAEFADDLRAAMPEIEDSTAVRVSVPAPRTSPPTGPHSTVRQPHLTGRQPHITSHSLSLASEMATRPESAGALRKERQVTKRKQILQLAILALLAIGIGVGVYVGMIQENGPPSANNKGAKAKPPEDLCVAGSNEFTGKPVRFGITAYLGKKELCREHFPLLKYLSQRLERPVRLLVREAYVNLAEELVGDKMELAALASYAYVRAMRKQKGLKLLATHVTSSGNSYDGFIVARADSDYRSIKDLAGRKFCYVSHTSTSGYLFPRAEFRRQGMDPDTAFKSTMFAGDHPRALRMLYDGACDGAAVFAGMLYEAKKLGMAPEKFKILLSTRRIPYDAYCVSNSLPKELADKIKAALLALAPGSSEARQVLGDASRSRIKAFAPAKDSDYDSVRAIEKYVEDPKPKTKKP